MTDDSSPSQPSSPDADADADARHTDAGVTDAGSTDAESTDAESTDAGAADAEAADTRTTDRRSISGRVRVSWGLRMLVGVAVLTLGATVVAVVVDALPVWIGPAVGVLALVAGVAWVHRRWQVWVYEVRADSLYLERGVITHVRTIAPFVRIQHVDTQRGPLERWLGLSTLVVYTAGTRGADVSIPGLTPAEARDLQSRVKELAIDAEGGDAV